MNQDPDRVEESLRVLKARSCERAEVNPYLEDRIMQEFSKMRKNRRGRWVGALAIGAVIAASGIGFAANGGIETVKGWFGKMEVVGPDGESKSFNVRGDELTDDQGNAVGRLTISGGGEDGASHEMTVTRENK